MTQALANWDSNVSDQTIEMFKQSVNAKDKKDVPLTGKKEGPCGVHSWKNLECAAHGTPLLPTTRGYRHPVPTHGTVLCNYSAPASNDENVLCRRPAALQLQHAAEHAFLAGTRARDTTT